MALESDKDAGRAGLPFEPKRNKKKAQSERASEKASEKASASGKQSASASNSKVSSKGSSKGSSKANSKPSKKGEDSTSEISARAQARAEEILAGNRKAKAASKKGADSSGSRKSGSRKTTDSGAIPEAVSRRMLRRMAVLSGAPVFLGVGIFFLAYYLQSNQIVTFPPIAVLLVTMGCFGLGVLGLTYGVMSASWDTEPGSLVGITEFKLNFGRVRDARKASKT
jgi:hypothetical protein